MLLFLNANPSVNEVMNEYAFIAVNEIWSRDSMQNINNLPGSHHFWKLQFKIRSWAVFHVVKNSAIIRNKLFTEKEWK